MGNYPDYRMEKMQLTHLNDVLSIERESFPTPWSRYAFWGEIVENDLARYFVARSTGKEVVGYAGLWVIFDEAHVTTIAVHPDHRQKKLGELLMGRLVECALAEGVKRMTLEVRPSNFIARRMYEKFGFVATGVRRGYYGDTGEDAIIMWNNLEQYCSKLEAGN